METQNIEERTSNTEYKQLVLKLTKAQTTKICQAKLFSHFQRKIKITIGIKSLNPWIFIIRFRYSVISKLLSSGEEKCYDMLLASNPTILMETQNIEERTSNTEY